MPLDESARRNSLTPVFRWLFRWEMAAVVVFVPLYKLGDSTLGRMVKPFWVDRGYSMAEIGTISVTLGVVLTILGALTGGWFVNRYGIFWALLWLGLAQLVSNLGYVAVASVDLPRESIYVASIVESFTQGLGTAAFLSFLMNLCDKEHAATQYAILTALMAVTRDIGGAFTGIGVEALGYATYFAVTTALALARPRLAAVGAAEHPRASRQRRRTGGRCVIEELKIGRIEDSRPPARRVEELKVESLNVNVPPPTLVRVRVRVRIENLCPYRTPVAPGFSPGGSPTPRP